MTFWQHLVEMWGEEHAIECLSMYAGGGGGMICRAAPQVYQMLIGHIVRLNIAKLPVSDSQKIILMKAYLDSGVRIPGTQYKINVTATSQIQFETSLGDEPELPDCWLQYVSANGTWVGKEVIDDRDLAGYSQCADGWLEMQ